MNYLVMGLILVVLGLVTGMTILAIDNAEKEAKLETLRRLVFDMLKNSKK